MEQFSLPFENTPKEEMALTKEVILQWSREERNAMYKQLIGQLPFSDMTPEQVAAGILNPESERGEVLRRNLEEDKGEVTSTYRR